MIIFLVGYTVSVASFFCTQREEVQPVCIGLVVVLCLIKLTAKCHCHTVLLFKFKSWCLA